MDPAVAIEIQRRSRSFRNRSAFRSWLEKNHARAPELLVRCFRVTAGKRGITYREALDEALCFGWIDGVRRGLDGESFSVRFTPRRPKSRWSTVNIRRVKELEREGRMAPPGLAAYRVRTKSAYSFESRKTPLAPSFIREFRARSGAWSYFQSCPPWYRRTTAFWVMSAKRPETRARRFARLVSCSAKGEHLGSV